jgi:hypothetical protein
MKSPIVLICIPIFRYCSHYTQLLLCFQYLQVLLIFLYNLCLWLQQKSWADLIIVWRIGKGWEGMALSSSRLWHVWRFRDPLSILSGYFHCRGPFLHSKFNDKISEKIYLLKRKSRSIIRTRNF